MQKGSSLCDTLQLPHGDFFFGLILFCFLLEGRCSSRGWIWRDREIIGIGVHDVKFTKKKVLKS